MAEAMLRSLSLQPLKKGPFPPLFAVGNTLVGKDADAHPMSNTWVVKLISYVCDINKAAYVYCVYHEGHNSFRLLQDEEIVKPKARVGQTLEMEMSSGKIVREVLIVIDKIEVNGDDNGYDYEFSLVREPGEHVFDDDEMERIVEMN